jgi:putative flippase GtrA
MTEDLVAGGRKAGGNLLTTFVGSAPLRFLVVGAGNTVVGLSVFPIIYLLLGELVDSITALLLITYLITGSLAYTTQRRLVFSSKARVITSTVKFVALQSLAFAANSIGLHALVRELGLHPIVGQLMIIPPIVLVSYLGSRYWVFRGKPSESRTES